MGKRTFLFNVGDQCTGITGGWTTWTDLSDFVSIPEGVTWASASIDDTINLYAKAYTDSYDDEHDSGSGRVGAYTTRPIDLTNVEKIVCGGVSRGGDTNHDNDAVYALYITKTPTSFSYRDYNVESTSVAVLDVSSYSGTYYVCIYVKSRAESASDQYYEGSTTTEIGTVYLWDNDGSEVFGDGASRTGFVGVSNSAHKLTKGYVGVDGKARKLKRGYVGVNGKARLIWDAQPAAVAWYYNGSYGHALTNGFKGLYANYTPNSAGEEDGVDWDGTLTNGTDSYGLFQEPVLRMHVWADNATSIDYFMTSTSSIDFTDVDTIEIEFGIPVGNLVSSGYGQNMNFGIGITSNQNYDVWNGSTFLACKNDIQSGTIHTIRTAVLNCANISGKHYLALMGGGMDGITVNISKIIAHYK